MSRFQYNRSRYPIILKGAVTSPAPSNTPPAPVVIIPKQPFFVEDYRPLLLIGSIHPGIIPNFGRVMIPSLVETPFDNPVQNNRPLPHFQPPPSVQVDYTPPQEFLENGRTVWLVTPPPINTKTYPRQVCISPTVEWLESGKIIQEFAPPPINVIPTLRKVWVTPSVEWAEGGVVKQYQGSMPTSVALVPPPVLVKIAPVMEWVESGKVVSLITPPLINTIPTLRKSNVSPAIEWLESGKIVTLQGALPTSASLLPPPMQVKIALIVEYQESNKIISQLPIRANVAPTQTIKPTAMELTLEASKTSQQQTRPAVVFPVQVTVSSPKEILSELNPAFVRPGKAANVIPHLPLVQQPIVAMNDAFVAWEPIVQVFRPFFLGININLPFIVISGVVFISQEIDSGTGFVSQEINVRAGFVSQDINLGVDLTP